MEEVKVLNIDTTEAQKNVQATTDKVNALNNSLDKTSTNVSNASKQMTDGFKAASNGLTTMTADNKLASQSLTDLSKVLGSAGGSLNSFVGTMGLMSKATAALQGGLGGLTTGFASVTKAGLKFIMNPVGATIAAIALAVMALVGVFNKLKEAIAKNDDASTGLAKLYAVTIQPVIDKITQAFDFLATAIGKVASKLADWFASTSEAAKANNDLVESLDRLQDAERNYTLSSAENQREISELRAKAAEKEKYSAKEREGFLKEAIDLEKSNLEEEKRIKAERLRLLEEEAKKNRDTSDETKDKIAQARAELINTETNYNNTVRRLNKELTSAQKEDAAEVAAAAKKRQEAVEAAAKAEEEKAREEKERANTALDIRLEQNKRLEQSDLERLENEKIIEQERLALLEEGTLAYEQQLTRIQSLDDKMTELSEKAEAKKKKEDEEALERYNTLFSQTESELQQIQDSEDRKFAILEEAHERGLISDEEYGEAKKRIVAETNAALDKLDEQYLKSRVSAGVSLVKSMTSIGKSLSSVFADDSKEAFEAQKAFEISSAVINTLTGAIGAYTGGASNAGLNAIPIVGPAIAQATGVAGAVAVAAGGAAQIAEISKRKYNDKNTNVSNRLSSADASNVSSQAIQSTLIPPTQYSQAVQGAEIETRLEDTKVYVTEEDITNTQKKVSVQESENRF